MDMCVDIFEASIYIDYMHGSLLTVDNQGYMLEYALRFRLVAVLLLKG